MGESSGSGTGTASGYGYGLGGDAGTDERTVSGLRDQERKMKRTELGLVFFSLTPPPPIRSLYSFYPILFPFLSIGPGLGSDLDSSLGWVYFDGVIRRVDEKNEEFAKKKKRKRKIGLLSFFVLLLRFFSSSFHLSRALRFRLSTSHVKHITRALGLLFVVLVMIPSPLPACCRRRCHRPPRCFCPLSPAFPLLLYSLFLSCVVVMMDYCSYSYSYSLLCCLLCYTDDFGTP